MWKDFLESLGMSKPHNKYVKKRGDIQSYFLYCSLYPMTIPTDDLIHIADGQMGYLVNVTHEAYNTGITMIESLKDACLLEMYEFDSVKMHDVVQDVGYMDS